jgi:regulator of RNase E activity RraA
MADDTQELSKLLGAVSTAAITGYLYKKHGMRFRALQNVQALDPAKCRFCGPAFTLRYVPQREDLNVATDLGSPDSYVLKADEQIRRGDVLVIDMQRDTRVGALGDVLVSGFIARGVAAIVADGGMRDVRDIRSFGLPVVSGAAVAPPAPSGLMPVGIQEIIACGGVTVFPGDFMVGDEDGVVVVPAHLAREVAEAGIEKERLDLWVRNTVAKGGGVRGRYPPDAEHLAMYEKWKKEQR